MKQLLSPLDLWGEQKEVKETLLRATSPGPSIVSSIMSDSAIPWTVVHNAPLSMGFPRQEYWSGLPFPPPWDLPHRVMEPLSVASPASAIGFFTTSST